MCQSAQATTTKYHTLGGLSNRNLFLTEERFGDNWVLNTWGWWLYCPYVENVFVCEETIAGNVLSNGFLCCTFKFYISLWLFSKKVLKILFLVSRFFILFGKRDMWATAIKYTKCSELCHSITKCWNRRGRGECAQKESRTDLKKGVNLK